MNTFKGDQGVSLAPASLTLEGALDALDRFALVLRQSNDHDVQMRLTLETVRDSLDADAVVWYPGTTRLPVERIGEMPLTGEWVEKLLDRLQSSGPRAEQYCRHFLDPGAKPASPWPYSAALVRVSRACNSWLLALSFHPRRLFQPADVKFMLLARRLLLGHQKQAEMYDTLRHSLLGLVRCLTAAIDSRDPFTRGHSERVARIAIHLGKQMGMQPALLGDLYLAGLLHDIGMIGVRECVLRDTGTLSEADLDHIRQHPLIGDRVVSTIPTLQHLRPGVRNHHERWDGTGYPDRLRGEQIPLTARILAVADACAAMMETRPYRPALPTEQIDRIMITGAGRQWDPDVIAHFMTCREELYAICRQNLSDPISRAVERALRVGVLTGQQDAPRSERDEPAVSAAGFWDI